jgi:hypothetical protein
VYKRQLEKSISVESSHVTKAELETSKGDEIDPDGATITARFKAPPGYVRVLSEAGTFENYLQEFPLKKRGSKVYYFDGREKPLQDVHEAVLDIDTGNKDLQQCADAIMRLRAEYLYLNEQYDKIQFNFTNGFPALYNKWAEGYRIKVKGNKATWYKASDQSDYSYETFMRYLEIVFTYAGTISLSKEMISVPVDDVRIGDVFIYGGSPGHAVLVVDLAVNESNGNKIFLLAQSYMPAQDMHLLKNPVDDSLSPWYDLSETDKLYTPEYTFEKTELKRFDD